MIALGFGLPFFATEPFLTEPIAFPGFEIGEHLFPISHLLSPVDWSLGSSFLKRGAQYLHFLPIKRNLLFHLISHSKRLLSIPLTLPLSPEG